ncbi:hypothetical protein OROHE_009573 [Orobanche hederae]
MADGFQAVVNASPISAQGNLAAPCQNLNVGVAGNHVAEGGPSICRDGDPLQPLTSVSGAKPLQAASSPCQTESALKVSDESSSRDFPAVKSAPVGLLC